MKEAYNEQLKFTFENNWANELRNTRQKYDIGLLDKEIEKMSKRGWKRRVKATIRNYSLNLLNNKLLNLKHSPVGTYQHIKQQEYLQDLQPKQARHIFHMRAGVIDLKCVRKYCYEDTTCRLCKQGEENADHVINNCSEIQRSSHINNIYTNEVAILEDIARRLDEFKDKLKDVDE